MPHDGAAEAECERLRAAAAQAVRERDAQAGAVRAREVVDVWGYD